MKRRMEQKSKNAISISIIGGADGPTSIFTAGHSKKQPLKIRIKNSIYRYKRKKVEKTIVANPHSLSETVQYAKDKYELTETATADPCELSGGQRQRVALASIIVQDPDIIVIDEPTSQLDPKGTEDVFEIIKYLNRQKKTIVLVEHKMNLIAEYADHIVYLNDGSVLLDGSPEDVLSSEILYEKNLDMPYVAVLGFQARSRGLFIDKIPTTVDEALKIFTECVQKSKGGSDGCGLS